MKKWRNLGLCVILTLGFLLVSGCTNTGSMSAAPAVTLTPTPTTAVLLVNKTAGELSWIERTYAVHNDSPPCPVCKK